MIIGIRRSKTTHIIFFLKKKKKKKNIMLTIEAMNNIIWEKWSPPFESSNSLSISILFRYKTCVIQKLNNYHVSHVLLKIGGNLMVQLEGLFPHFRYIRRRRKNIYN